MEEVGINSVHIGIHVIKTLSLIVLQMSGIILIGWYSLIIMGSDYKKAASRCKVCDPQDPSRPIRMWASFYIKYFVIIFFSLVLIIVPALFYPWAIK